ncbi:glycosyltransferase family 2 protein [Embleya sp. NPDC050154]|uniref:glycosyltransferase family 2 protein n=1 Tax=Embleya sp. NPDC050154 TaxID=3363988 RepID=UPI0037B30307
MSEPLDLRVCVVVIVYNDADRLAEAVRSALTQGEVVGELVIVDDASTDATPEVCARLAAEDPRVRIVRRADNSGGCGSPRNDGVRAARAARIVFLDSDDVLPPGAVAVLSAAADAHDAEVVAGLCVRRELPRVRDVPWQPQLFTTAAVHADPELRPETVWDTLSVNKLYDRAFLLEHDIRFPDGAAHYEDFVFTARLYAAGPRLAVVPDHVYTWHVRRDGGDPSISLRRDRVANWLDRLDAHRQVVDIFTEAGRTALRAAALTKFLEHDLRLYLRDLGARTAEYREEWWRACRAHLASFEPEAFARAFPTARWAAAVIAAHETPAGVARLAELAAEPPRLIGPYPEHAGTPVWDETGPKVVLDGLAEIAPADLPAVVEANVRGTVGNTLDVTVHDLYGRLAAAGPVRLDLELRDRHGIEVRAVGVREGLLRGLADASGWSTTVTVEGTVLAGAEPFTVWDVWARVHLAEGPPLVTKVRAGTGLGRRLRPDLRHGVAFVQFYRTASRSLAIRHAGGGVGVREVLGARLRRRRAS